MQHTGALFKLMLTRLCTAAAMILMTITLASCATSDAGFSPTERVGSKVQVCRSGDQLVNASSQCLQDGAACYQLDNGKWCTGARGNICPAGSVELPTGAACPRGARCIKYAENLSCAIQFR